MSHFLYIRLIYFTFTLMTVFLPLSYDIAVTFAVPRPTAVSFPELDTRTTRVFDESHLSFLFVAPEGYMYDFICFVRPLYIVTFVGESLTFVTETMRFEELTVT